MFPNPICLIPNPICLGTRCLPPPHRSQITERCVGYTLTPVVILLPACTLFTHQSQDPPNLITHRTVSSFCCHGIALSQISLHTGLSPLSVVTGWHCPKSHYTQDCLFCLFSRDGTVPNLITHRTVSSVCFHGMALSQISLHTGRSPLSVVTGW